MIKYPDGKLKEDDEGALQMAVFIKDGRLIIDFGKELSWIGFAKQDVKNLVDLLNSKLKNL